MSAPNSLFVRAAKAQPTERTPIWLMRQAGRYMAEYRAVRKKYSLIEICKKPEVAAQVTIEAAEILKVDAAIIFADLLLPLEVMGLPFHFAAGEGPKIEKPVRTRADIALASYMIEGGGSRNYVFTKKMMYSAPDSWNELMRKLVSVTAEYSAEQVRAGADTIQIFDSWVGCLSVEDYRRYVLPHSTDLVNRLQKTGVPIIYFGTDSATLLPSMKETGAEVVGLDWRIPLDAGWQSLGFQGAVQGNLDPVLLFADWKVLKPRAEDILRRAAGRPGHIFNLGHGILPETPVDNVKALCDFIREHSAEFRK
ncbi:MAG: uroporphyrinogen decarboxylase [Acidobacteriia bacterium]|nr:uroporphyrinogen decarboxylase [Terriglobia bacterium]